jgi:hypothetical protein
LSPPRADIDKSGPVFAKSALHARGATVAFNLLLFRPWRVECRLRDPGRADTVHESTLAGVIGAFVARVK